MRGGPSLAVSADNNGEPSERSSQRPASDNWRPQDNRRQRPLRPARD